MRTSRTIWKALTVCLWIAGAGHTLAGQQAPADPLRLGVESLRTGDFPTAEAQLQQAVRLHPTAAEAFFDLGLVHDRLNRCGEAIQDFHRAIALKPTLRGAHLFEGICAYRLNDFAAAATSLTAETRLSPRDSSAWMWLGVVALARKDHAAAVDALQEANRLKPNDADILYHRGRALLLLSRDSYSAMFAVDPNAWRVHEVLAQGADESDHPADAATEYAKAIDLAPAEPGLHEALGTSLWKAGKLDEAEAAFVAELKLDPFSTMAQYKLGCLQIDRGHAEGGLPLLKKALQQDPSLITGHYYLGRAAAQMAHEDEAVTEFNAVLAGTDDKELRAQTLFQLARSYRRLKQTDNAQTALQRYQQTEDQLRSEQQVSLARRKALNTNQDANVPGPIPTEQ